MRQVWLTMGFACPPDGNGWLGIIFVITKINIAHVMDITFSTAWLCSIIYLAYDMGLHYLTFTGRNPRNRKKLTLTWLLNSVIMNSKNMVNDANIFKFSDALNSILIKEYRDEQWSMINVNSVGSITPSKFSSVSLNVWIVNEYSYFVWGQTPHP